MLRIGNGRATLLSDATAKLNVLMCEAGIDGKMLHRAQELRLERAHIPVFPLSWTLMHVLDEHSPLQGYDTARTIEAAAQLFVMFEARDPTLGTMVHDIRNYEARDIRFGYAYVDVITTAEDGTPVLDLTQIGALEPDVGDRQEHGWTQREAS
jgi:inward rectifier potassium channel